MSYNKYCTCSLYFFIPICYGTFGSFPTHKDVTMDVTTAILCLCILIVTIHSFTLVPRNSVAIRQTRTRFRGLTPGIHLKWPWQIFIHYDTHLINSDSYIYRAPSKDGMRMRVKILVEWIDLHYTRNGCAFNLYTHVRVAINSHTSDELSSPRTHHQIARAVRTISHENGRFFFNIKVISIEHEDDLFSATPLSPRATIPPPTSPRYTHLRCIPGGKPLHSPYKHSRKPRLHLHRTSEGEDGGAA